MYNFFSNHKRIIEVLAIVLILAAAAFLRLYRISEYMTFLGDEGRDVLVVKRMIVDHKFTLLGPTASVGGFFLGPVYYYFMLPFLWAWKLGPTGPAVMVALFGIITVFLVYLFGKRAFGTYAGLLAASLYAVSPLVIAYSRSSWNPNVVPFFSILLFWFLVNISVREKKSDWIFTGFILGIGIQLHYLFLFQYAAVGLWILYLTINKRRLLWSNYILTIFGIVLGLSPFLAFEIRHEFANTQTIIKFLTAGKDTGFDFLNFTENVRNVWFRIFARLVFYFPDQAKISSYSAVVVSFWRNAINLFQLFVLFSSILFIRYKYTGKVDKPAKISHEISSNTSKLLLTVLFTVILFFGFYKKEIYDYYLGIVFVIPFILSGFTFSYMRKYKYGLFVSLVIYLLLLFINIEGRPFKYPPNSQLAQMRRISQVAFEKTGGQPFNFALVTDGNSDHAYRYFFEIWGNPPVTIENNELDPGRKTVTDQLIVICETINCQPLGNSLWEIAGFGRAEIVGSWEVPFVTIYKLIHYSENI